ncbi:MAG TPA: DNA polymerase I [Prolixibacteraceae bacterium]|nr:DNA polymerase I [Prolixibacteraceae bacterium]HOS89275.1 DNA polymerase I [Prolixibacteraceae bacterium]HQE51997.1 DNA polymerase I [Prolixibacteraceae bacterium]HQH76375.1 DNA polymerase I [Prolixibacteraceae bacterium]HQJ86259.1 DNA polymerase I [Prolixibacteraceae bacterium]
MTDNTDKAERKLFLLDAYALIYRSYFAFIRNPRFNSKRVNTSAALGFANTLVQLLENEKPEYIGVVFDMSKPTFRHAMFPEYKANRQEMPEDLRKAVPYIRKMVEAFRIPILEKEGYEADDIIGTLARQAAGEGFKTYMMTPDKDYAQLVGEGIYMYKPGKGGNDIEIWGAEEVRKNFDLADPRLVIDLLGLMGDSSDNIPGCPGIGPKNAVRLLSDFGDIDGIYRNIDKITGKQKENLLAFEQQVRMSRELATIMLDVPVSFEPEKLRIEEPDQKALRALFEDLEFRNLLERLQLSGAAEKPREQQPVQGTLFGMEAPAATPEERPAAETLETTPHQYYLVENEMQRASLRAELAVQPSFCFDTETTGLDPHTAELVCISFAFRNHEAYCVPIPPNRKEATQVVLEFREVFGDERILKVGQNLKYDLLMLSQYGLEVKGKMFDTMLAHYLLQPEWKHNLDYLSETYLNYRKIPTENLIGPKGRSQLTMRAVEKEKLRDYACEDADLTFQLKAVLEPLLEESGLTALFTGLEMPLVPVLADMERTGVKLDTRALNDYAGELRRQIIDLEEEIHSLAGMEFNVSSPKQLGEILFEKLKIDPNARLTKTKQYSTNEEVLTRLKDQHPIVGKVLEYRGLKKLLNTYVETLPELINPRTGKIHTSYNQAVTATGRLSSNNPNLQNIPIRDENGREIRKAFIPSDEEHLFLSADYSQIELRIMAALSDDPQMVEAFAKNQDIHALTAAKIYKIPVQEVTSDMRRKAKTANFGIIYGISAFGLSQRLNISRTEAKELIDGYFENFPRVREYMEKSIENARKEGFVQTIMGRRRYLSDINSNNQVVRGMAERNAINAPIQGSAADIIKVAMVNIFREFEKAGLSSKMVIQVHDELNFDVAKPELEQVKDIVRKQMETAVILKVPLTVEMNEGLNWLDAH